MKKLILIFVGLVSMGTAYGYECFSCYEETNKQTKNSILTDIIIDSGYQTSKSTYYNLGDSQSNTKFIKIDLSNYLNYENFGITSSIRALNSDIDDSNYKEKNNSSDTNIESKNINDIYFRTLYLSYKLPQINDINHMVAVGTMPFDNGSWNEYKGKPQMANGLSLLLDMSFDAIVYIADIRKPTNTDFFQIRLGHGEYLKFDDLYNHSKQELLSAKKTNINFINFDIKENVHNFKLEGYQTNWLFDNTYIGTVNNIGVGYAYNKLQDDGYVLYGTVAKSIAKGSYKEYTDKKMHAARDSLITGFVQKHHVDYNTAANMVDTQLSNITPEFVAEANGITLKDTGLVQGKETSGWAFQVGGKKELWSEEFDINWFIGADYFKSSKDWVTTTVETYTNNSIDTLIKGEAYHIGSGINFDNNKILTFSWVHENRKWVPSAINDVVGLLPEETNRKVLTERDIFRVNFVWMFLGL